MHKNHFFTMLWITAAATAWAASPDTDSSKSLANQDSIEALSKIVITASRTKRLLSETPANASVISRSTIAASPAHSIEDLLITQTGVQAKRTSGMGEGIPSDIIIRGIPGSLLSPRTLILVDGIPTNVSGTPFLIINEVPIEALERIEIVRGPYSSLYGANAFGGVVNMITQSGSGPFHGLVSTETSYPFSVVDRYFSDHSSMSNALTKAGPLALYNVTGVGEAGNEKAGFMVSGGYRTIGNYLLRDSAYVDSKPQPYYKKADNYNYTDFRLFGKGHYFPSSNTSLILNLRYFKSDLGFGRTKNILPDSQDIITKGEKFLIGPQAKIKITDFLTVHASGFFRHVTGEYFNEAMDSLKTDVRTYWKSQTNDWQIESQGYLTLADNNTLTVGAEMLRNNADFGATVNASTDRMIPNSFPTQKGIANSAGYVQDEWKPLEGLLVVPVARLDYHSQFGAAFSPKMGVSYGPLSWLRIRASAGRSFRAPSLAELYLPDLQVNPDFYLKANPNLKPEYIWGYDGGFEFSPQSNLTCKLGVFFNKMNNLISQAVIFDSTSNYITHRNVTSATSEGIESEARWKALNWLTASGHLTLENSNDETYNVPLDFVPELLFGLGLSATHAVRGAVMQGEVNFNYVGTRRYLDFNNPSLNAMPDGSFKLSLGSIGLPAYGTVDLSYKVTFTKGWWLSLVGQNIFNALYQEAAGTLAPGRLAAIKAGYNF